MEIGQTDSLYVVNPSTVGKFSARGILALVGSSGFRAPVLMRKKARPC
jgi:hypothetical protein